MFLLVLGLAVLVVGLAVGFLADVGFLLAGLEVVVVGLTRMI